MEAIKKAVEVGLGAAFVSRSAVQKELQLGLLSAVEIEVHHALHFSASACAAVDIILAIQHCIMIWTQWTARLFVHLDMFPTNRGCS